MRAGHFVPLRVVSWTTLPSLYFASRYNMAAGGSVPLRFTTAPLVRVHLVLAKGCRRESRRVRLRRGAGVEPLERGRDPLRRPAAHIRAAPRRGQAFRRRSALARRPTG